MLKHLILCLLTLGLSNAQALAQEETPVSDAETKAEAKKEAESKEPALKGPSQAAITDTLGNLMRTERRLRTELAALRKEALATSDSIVRGEIEETVTQKRAEIDQVAQRIEWLATGVEPADYDLSKKAEFNLQNELQQLAEPFVAIMKSATEEARTIERLRRLEQTARGQAAVAKRAVSGIQPLIAQAKSEEDKARLTALLENWEIKEREAMDLAVSTQRQLEVKLSEQGNAAESGGAAVQNFLNTRGRNLLFGLFAFGVVFTVMRLIGRLVGAQTVSGKRRSFARRLFQLVFTVLTIILSFVAMLAVFNALNDWLLFGLGILLLLAAIWLVLKTLPSLIERTTLLLNLGAVQEGERIMFNGIPFRVEKLDFYSDLVNPRLRGGRFTIPVSELAGFHSRPVAKDEVWFPCNEGDTVILEDERWGRITFQSPEAVIMEDDGGSENIFEAASFLGKNPRNLSKGYRTESEFGVDYKHQAIATTEIPQKMAQDVRVSIEKKFGKQNVRNVAVEFIRADDSALVYEVEADMTGAAAWQWEEVQFELARAAVDSCTKNGWNIPFPHISLNKLN